MVAQGGFLRESQTKSQTEQRRWFLKCQKFGTFRATDSGPADFARFLYICSLIILGFS